MTTHSSIAVVVISKGRHAVLKETLQVFPQQTLKPSQIIVVVTDENDLPPQDRPDFIEFYIGKAGICRQRNYGLEKVRPNTDYVAFFDDDVELRADYLENAVQFLNDFPGIAAMSGRIIKDGNVDRKEARRLIAEFKPVETYKGYLTGDAKCSILYGCCMILRKSLLNLEKFDENLPLYGFAEDYEISMRMKRYGIIGRFQKCIGVHLRTPGGRVNEIQRGYAIVANNWYFMRKGVSHLPPYPAMVRFWLVIFLKPLLLALWQILRRDKSMDWWGRAKGFCFAIADVVRGRSSPERMLDYSQ